MKLKFPRSPGRSVTLRWNGGFRHTNGRCFRSLVVSGGVWALRHVSHRKIAAKRWLGGPSGSQKPTSKLAAWEFDEALDWAAHPHANPAVLLRGNVLWEGEGMRCLCLLYFLAARRSMQAVPVRSRKRRGGRRSSSSSPASVCSLSVTPIVMINGGIWTLSTPVHEQPNLTAESRKCL